MIASTLSSRWAQTYFMVTTLFVAALSLLYELTLAQTLSALYGGTVLRYTVSVGIYIASLGIGALIYNRLSPLNKYRNLIRAEIVLSILGMIGPYFILWFDHIAANELGPIASYASLLISHLLLMSVGIFSGLELPALMEIYHDETGGDPSLILAADYIGSFLAPVTFPTLLIPHIDLFALSIGLGLLNLIIAWTLILRQGLKGYRWLYVIFILASLLLAFSSQVSEVILANFYFS